MPFFSNKRRKHEIPNKSSTYPHPILPSHQSGYAPPPNPQHLPYFDQPPARHNGTSNLYNSSAVALSTPNRYNAPEQRYTVPQYAPRPLDNGAWGSTYVDQTIQEQIGTRLEDVISLMDEDAFTESEGALEIDLPPLLGAQDGHALERSVGAVWPISEKGQPQSRKKAQPVNVFSKVDFYMNSRLPASLPPLRVYIPTYPLLCLAAQYSANAYISPQSRCERKDFVSADGRLGTKAMVIKSIPCDEKKVIVFAIRGTSMMSIRDWGINLQTDAVPPRGFLDDEGNLCHSGFLKVARAMVKPIAARLRNMLEEDPNRTSCSLLITGHSAGGAVASLLYAHMLSETVESELSILTGCFKRVHCVVFGAPPISILPLQKPITADGRLQKCLFFSFMNEGDPVVRAERAYVKSLVDLLSQPVPNTLAHCAPSSSALNLLNASMSRLDLSLKPGKPRPSKLNPTRILPRSLWWDVPPSYLSNAGRLIVLRIPDGGREVDVTASTVKDEQLRQVIFGNPLVHAMDVYARRIEYLAFRAVTGRNNS